MDIYQILPLLEGWDRIVILEYDLKVKPYEKKKLAESTHIGWIIASTIAYVGSKYNILRLYYHDKTGERHKMEANPAGLETMGIYGVGLLHGLRLAVADDNENTYCMIFNPARPIPYYASRDFPIMFEFEEKGGIGADIGFFGAEIVIIYDRDAFIKSLKEVMCNGC